MQFSRWGFSGAQPVFQPVQGMVEAKNLLKFEVGDRSVTGVDEAKKNTSVYRTDICGIDAPDAHLIAAAPELYEALEGVIQFCSDSFAGRVDGSTDEAWWRDGYREIIKRCRSSLAKARGETP